MSVKNTKILSIERHEVGLLLLMFIQAGLVGLFIGGFDIAMHAIYLKNFEAYTLNYIYLYSGIAGIILMFFYTFFSTRLRFRFFILLNYIIVFLTAVAIFYFSYIKVSDNYILAGFSLMFPLNIIIYLNFHRSLREILKPAQAKRLSNFLQAAFFAGIISSSYGSILFLFISSDFTVLLALSSASLLLAIVFQLIINPVHRRSRHFLHTPKRINPIRSRFIELFYTKYTFLLIVFVLLSSITAYLLHYSFIYSTRLNYPSIIGFIKFLGLFTGTLFLFTFIVDKALIRKILYSYDSPYSIVLIPFTLILFLLVSVGIYYTLGTQKVIARFSLFFLIVAMIKVVYELFRMNVEIPSFRVMFKTLDVRFHGTIIPRIDGTVRCAGLLIAGIILTVIVKLNILKIINLNILTLVVVILWFFIAIFLIKAYQKALQTTIKKFRSSKRGSDIILKAADEKLHQLINHKSPVKAINSLRISEKIEPVAFERHIINFIKDNSEKLKNYAFSKIEEQDLLSAYPLLKDLKTSSDGINLKGVNLATRFEQKISLGKTEEKIEKLAASGNINDRVLAADLIGYQNKKELSSILLNLSRDFEPDVKMAAVRAMGRSAFPETSHTLIEFLNSPLYYPFAFDALVKIGDDAIDHLEMLFDLPDTEERILSRIVKVYGKIGSTYAIECLLSKIEKHNRFISRQAIRALREARFQATPGNINRILNIIIRTIGLISWNLTALSTVKKSELHMLENALMSELEDNYKILYNLMALAYNSNSIANIQLLIEKGNDTDISFAIELLDQIVLDEVKQVLFPVIENLSIKARIKQLQYYFQNENYPVKELIPGIITRDFNQISVYTKACAILSWLKVTRKISNVLVANLFHPNKLIRETSAFVINRIDPNFLETVYYRLPENYVTDIKRSLEHIQAGTDFLVLEKVDFLKKCRNFTEVPEEILYEIATNIKVLKIVPNHFPSLKDVAFFVVFKGNVEVYGEGVQSVFINESELFYSNLYNDGITDINYKFRTQKESIIFVLDKNIFDMLMFDYSEFRIVILELIEASVDKF